MEDNYKDRINDLTTKIAELSQQLDILVENKDKSNKLLCNQIFDDFINNHYDRYVNDISIEINNYNETEESIAFEFTILDKERNICSSVYINNGIFTYEMKSIYKDYLYECLHHYATSSYNYNEESHFYIEIEQYDTKKMFTLYNALNSKLKDIDVKYSFDMIIAKFTDIGYSYLPDDKISQVLNNINRLRTLKAIE